MFLSFMLQIFLNIDNLNNTNIRSKLYILNKVDIINKQRMSNKQQIKEALFDIHELIQAILFL